jgi:hypothetical protein
MTIAEVSHLESLVLVTPHDQLSDYLEVVTMRLVVTSSVTWSDMNFDRAEDGCLRYST